ncbi:MAG: molecular chaperone TorD family protein [Hyphomicrobiaceae bacterium]
MGDEGARAGVAREGTGAEVTAVDAAEAAALARFRSGAADDMRLLAALHDHEPDAELIESLRTLPFHRRLALAMRGEEGRSAVAAIDAALAALPRPLEQATLDNLSVAFADIYLTYRYRAAPNESVWLDDDNLERQAPMFRVRQWYRRYGVGTADWAKRSEDHLVLELQFLAHLLSLAEAPEALADAARFLDQHLLRWVGMFAAQLRKAGAPPLYQGLADLTVAHLDELRQHLVAITGIARPVPVSETAEQKRARRSKVPKLPDCGGRPFVPGSGPSW